MVSLTDFIFFTYSEDFPFPQESDELQLQTLFCGYKREMCSIAAKVQGIFHVINSQLLFILATFTNQQHAMRSGRAEVLPRCQTTNSSHVAFFSLIGITTVRHGQLRNAGRGPWAQCDRGGKR